MILHHLFTHCARSQTVWQTVPACYALCTVYCVSTVGLDKVYIKVNMRERGERGSKFGLKGQRWSREHKARGQKHAKNSETKDSSFEAKDTGASVLQKKNTKGLQKHFSRNLKKKRSSKIFFRWSPKTKMYKIIMIQTIVLSSSRGQGNFRRLKASRPRISKCVLENSTSVNGMWQKNWKTVESWKQNVPSKTLRPGPTWQKFLRSL